jgi:hypothetical protein
MSRFIRSTHPGITPELTNLPFARRFGVASGARPASATGSVLFQLGHSASLRLLGVVRFGPTLLS